MADYGFNTNLGPQAQQPTSLSDLVQMARGVQSYQQAEQVNPLLLRQQQAATQLAEQTLKPKVEQEQTAAAKSKFGFSSEKAQKSREILGALATSDAFLSGNKSEMLKQIADTQQELIRAGYEPHEALLAITPVTDKAMRDPKSAVSFLENVVRQSVSPETQAAMQVGGTIDLNGVTYKYNKATNKLEPIGSGKSIGKSGEIGKTNDVIDRGQSTKSSGLVPIDMPVTGNVAQLNTQQKSRYDLGVDLLNKSSELAQAAGDSRQTIRQIQQNISQAAGSKPEQILRNAKRWAVGSEQLDELVKSLADNQMRQAQMMGVGTDAARQTAGLASGSENITAGALKMITDRAEATNTAFEKFNKGLNSFKNKFGQYNGAIHADNFKRAWAENYDPLVFWVQNINASDMSKAEKQMEISKLLKGLSEEQRVGLAKKAENIKRLERGDF